MPEDPIKFEFVSEVSDLAAGAAMLTFTLAPFALPALALTVFAAVALLIPGVVGVVLAAPFLLARRWRRSRGRLSGDSRPSRAGGGKPGTRPARSFGSVDRLDAQSPSTGWTHRLLVAQER
jgi:hypothetical protein